MKAAEISDRKSFEAWLEAVPEAVRREVEGALASRCALRVLPFLRRGGGLNNMQHAKLTRFALQRNTVSRSVRRWPDRESANAATSDAASVNSAASHADIWGSVRDDATAVEQAGFVMGSGFQLFQDPLWKTQPNWFPTGCDQFLAMLHSLDWAADGWGIWWEWYEPIIEGKPAFGLKDRKAAEALERAIALGSHDGKFNKAF